MYVTKPSLPQLQEYIDEISSIWNSCQLTNGGEKHTLLEKMLEEYLGVNQVELVVNGHMALELAIQAFDLSGEVITTPYTFPSTIHAIVRNGLTPVFCDINSDDFNIDVSKIESLITDKTSAIIPVHTYGNPCDVEKIQAIAHKYGLKVIYDAAHTFGEVFKGLSLADYGDAACLSFHATKAFNTIEGGAICCSDKKIISRLKALKNFGIQDNDTISEIGTNAKMNEFCAAMGICNLRHFTEENLKRRAVDTEYRKRLGGIKGITLNKTYEDLKRNYAYFPVLIDENEFGVSRDEVLDKLSNKNIFCRKYFYPIVTKFDCYKDKFKDADTPVASKISSRVMCLPMYAELTIEDVNYICDSLINLTQSDRNLRD